MRVALDTEKAPSSLMPFTLNQLHSATFQVLLPSKAFNLKVNCTNPTEGHARKAAFVFALQMFDRSRILALSGFSKVSTPAEHGSDQVPGVLQRAGVMSDNQTTGH